MKKSQPIVILLVVSLLLNALGIAAVCVLIQTKNRVAQLKKQNSRLEKQVSLASTRQNLADMESESNSYRREFVSQVDGQPDHYLLLAPQSLPASSKYRLIVYFHGMGGDCTEPFVPLDGGVSVAQVVVAHAKENLFASLSYRKKESWCTELACDDISQNIHELMVAFPVKSIVLAGTSMGGTAALTYLVNAPEDIRSKIEGVLSMEGTGDVAELYRTSSNAEVQGAIVRAFGGTPEAQGDKYKKFSFLANLDTVKPGVKFAVLSAIGDTTVPAQLQKDVANQLKARNFPVEFIEFERDHGPPHPDSIRQGLRFVCR